MIKYILFLVFSIWMIPSFAKSGTKSISLNNKRIEYVGRWDQSNPNKYHSYWGGAYFEMKFTGKEVKLQLAAPVNIYVKIDEQKEILYSNANGLVKITPDSLTDGVHQIRVIAKFQNDEMQLVGLFLNDKARILKLPKKNKWIEFIGDSITSGDRTSKGNTSAYPWLVGDSLKVEHSQISYCGIALTSGYHYHYKGAPKIGMDSAYFNLKQPNSELPNSLYHLKHREPNLIVINLGTNDSHLQVPSAIFQSHYSYFITSIRKKYPKSMLVLLMPFNGAYHSEIKNMVNQSLDSLTNLKIIETKGWLKKSDFSDGTHPTDAGHEIISQNLSPILKEYLK